MEHNFQSKSRRYLNKSNDMYSALLCAYPPNDHDLVKNREEVIAVSALNILYYVLFEYSSDPIITSRIYLLIELSLHSG